MSEFLSVHDEKYIVFKRSEWDTFKARGMHKLEAVADAVVIRTQDCFAAAGLSAYEQNIKAFLAIMAIEDLGEGYMSPGLEATLVYITSVRQEAEARLAYGECKVPD